MLSGNQLSFIAIFVLIFLGLYLGFDIRPQKQMLIEKSRALSQESIRIADFLEEKKLGLDAGMKQELNFLENQLLEISVDFDKIPILEQLAGNWYGIGFPILSGYYAEEIAKVQKDNEEAWAITGTTYALALKSSTEVPVREFCRKHAVEAFEMAISLNPENISHRINTALVYTDFPLDDNPMKGIQMLLDLNSKYPESTLVLVQLGNLAIETRQFDRAIERFSKVLEIDQLNVPAICGMVSALEGAGLVNEARGYAEKCNLLVKNKN